MAAFLSAFRLAMLAISRNKLRTSLTMLGILIGVAAVVVTTALGAGAREKINGQIESLGSNVMLVFPQPNQASGARGAQGNPWLRLTEDDAKALLRGSTSIAGAAPFLRANAAGRLRGPQREHPDLRHGARIFLGARLGGEVGRALG